MADCITYVGLHVPKEGIVVAIAEGGGRRPSDGTAPHGLGSASAYVCAGAGPSASACACPRAFGPDGGGTVGDQLSLAVAVISPP